MKKVIIKILIIVFILFALYVYFINKFLFPLQEKYYFYTKTRDYKSLYKTALKTQFTYTCKTSEILMQAYLFGMGEANKSLVVKQNFDIAEAYCLINKKCDLAFIYQKAIDTYCYGKEPYVYWFKEDIDKNKFNEKCIYSKKRLKEIKNKKIQYPLTRYIPCFDYIK